MSIYGQVKNLKLTSTYNGVDVTYTAPAASEFVQNPAVAEIAVCKGTSLGPQANGYPLYDTGIVPGFTYNYQLPYLEPQTTYIVAIRLTTPAHANSAQWVTQVFTTPPVLPVLPYVNPFAAATILAYERVDQGVDFAGTGPILALGNGVITETNGPGWPGGPYMAYKLSDGPAEGLYVYVAEDLTPVEGDSSVDLPRRNRSYGRVNVTRSTPNRKLSLGLDDTLTIGQKITAGQVIATMFNGDNGIEIGWGRTTDGLVPESQLAVCGSINGNNLPAGGTMIGRNFEELLNVLGVPLANNLNDVPGGSMPAGWPTWLP